MRNNHFFISPVVCTLALLLSLCAINPTQSLAQAIRYVKPVATGTGDGSSWANASGNLQAMINNSVFLDEVRVAQGLYFPTLDENGNTNSANPRRRTFTIPAGLRVRGGYVGTGMNPNQRLTAPSTTTLSGDLGVAGDFSDNAYHVVTMPNALSVVLDGFVITKGNANTSVSGNGIRDRFGGAILMINLTQPVVTPTIFRVYMVDNRAADGGAIANFGGGTGLNEPFPTAVSNPNITFCQFFNNQASRNGGAFYNSGNTSPKFFNCVFQDNSATQAGGALCNESNGSVGTTISSAPSLTGCMFESNSAVVSGGAIQNQSNPGISVQPLIERCSFTNNLSNSTIGRGGAIYSRTNGGELGVTVRSCWFNGNSASDGGAICNISASSTANVGMDVLNCTLTGNFAQIGGGVYQSNTTNTAAVDPATINLSNTIIWGNTASSSMPGVASYGHVAPNADFSIIQGCVGQSWCSSGVRNADTNPYLGADNLTPTAISPAINLGNPFSSTSYVGSTDYNGAPRIQGGQIDIGAVESDIPQTTVVSVKSGDWNNIEVWDCYCIPRSDQTAVLHFPVRIPANYTARARKLITRLSGTLRYSTPNARLIMIPEGSF